ncbi:TRAP transporter permease [Ferviditalea candida]|uniref:TRAP transporter permease n=1 Tax=Ferviditalea candida TaxID=3108399 RepID=A0ABU5ZI01_9BACL|nr:TRAP transporter permease [Paenibacillaceae bacterium T2]
MNEDRQHSKKQAPANQPPEEPNVNAEMEGKRYRQFKSSTPKVILYTLLSLIPISGILYVLGVQDMIGLTFYQQQFIGLFLGLVLCSVYLSIPATKKSRRDSVPWYDWLLAALGLYAGLYLVIFYPQIVMIIGNVDTPRLVISVIAVVLVMEAIRRLLGTAMLTIVLFFLLYGYFAPYFPGIFRGTHTSLKQLFNYLYLDPNSMLDLINIAATVALSFIFFGQILLHFGGADILNNLALSLFGRFRGGPAKGSIVGSSLVGTITGGPVTNVMLVGSVTIPLMKRNGYDAVRAGAIESVASTGGSIMPPVMGISAFIIAETLGVSYAKVAIAALIPAILFYLTIFFQVDLHAGRHGIRRLRKEDIPSIAGVLKTGWTILPTLVALVYFLFFKGYSPQISGLYSAVVAIVFLSLPKDIRRQMFSFFPRIFVDSGRVLLEITVVLAAAGLIVGVTGVTGLGFNLGLILSDLAQYGLLTLLAVSAIVSVILGMGMPAVAAYSLVAVLVAPTMVQMGVNPFAAHLFVFYFSIISNFTPPVALACFTAAPIAQASPHKIGFRAMQLGITAYIVPFLFVYSPQMLLGATNNVNWTESILTWVTAVIGCYLIAAALEGFLFNPINWIKRLILIVLGVCLLMPLSIWQYSWLLNLIAFIAMVLLFLYEAMRIKKMHVSSSAKPVDAK